MTKKEAKNQPPLSYDSDSLAYPRIRYRWELPINPERNDVQTAGPVAPAGQSSEAARRPDPCPWE